MSEMMKAVELIVQDWFEILSLWLTVPCVGLAIWVAIVFVGTAHEILFHKKKKDWTGGDWIAVGIAIGFTGQALDNFYWFIPWTCSFLQLEMTDHLMQLGVFFNVPFRQITGILAAYCHLRGAQIQGLIGTGILNPVMKVMSTLGLAYITALLYIKGVSPK